MSLRTERTRPSVVVIERVAAREGTDPTRLTPPLHDVVDPDALDALCAESDTSGCIAFSYCGYTVTVGIDGAVSIEERSPAAGTDPVSAASAD
ncbi:hypothetical protein BRC94_13070 [Halobacteriales archaeon QS_5_70_17]|nr:MAG: hypothetical protein BRC94_13070 [Halobacteriales archaeon QS_5_70_17]